MRLNAKIIFAFIFLALPCFLLAQEAAPAGEAPVVAPEAAQPAPARRGKVFAPVSSRDPFLSREEVESIEAARLAEIRRIESERKRLEDAEKARLAEIERQRLLELEKLKNPAREVINKIRVEGVMGAGAIVNGQFKSVGESVLGARITKVSDTSVTFIYKGQTFVKQMR